MMLTQCLKFSTLILAFFSASSFAMQNLDLIEKRIKEYLGNDPRSIQVESVIKKDILSIDSIKKGRINCNYQFGRCSLIYKLNIRGNLTSVKVAWFKVSRLESVAVLKRDVVKGQVFEDSLVEYRNMYIQLGLNPIKSELIFKKFKSNIKKNTILRVVHLENNPVISENEKITIDVSFGSIFLEVEGLSLSSGMVGDKIKVMRRSNNQILDAFIISSGRVTAK